MLVVSGLLAGDVCWWGWWLLLVLGGFWCFVVFGWVYVLRFAAVGGRWLWCDLVGFVSAVFVAALSVVWCDLFFWVTCVF